MSIDELQQEAERRLQALGLSIVTDEELLGWNDRKNESGTFARDVEPSSGWVAEEHGFLAKEFYVHADKGDEHNFAHYRKAWFIDRGDGQFEFLLTDADHNELELPAVGTPNSSGAPRPA